jgi:hypothetical protein
MPLWYGMNGIAMLNRELQQRLGKENFPLVEQTFYGNYKQMVIAPAIPCVVKIGPYHSGFGKILIKDESQFDDIKVHRALCCRMSSTK